MEHRHSGERRRRQALYFAHGILSFRPYGWQFFSRFDASQTLIWNQNPSMLKSEFNIGRENQISSLRSARCGSPALTTSSQNTTKSGSVRMIDLQTSGSLPTSAMRSIRALQPLMLRRRFAVEDPPSRGFSSQRQATSSLIWNAMKMHCFEISQTAVCRLPWCAPDSATS